jgi:hypothetical protein
MDAESTAEAAGLSVDGGLVELPTLSCGDAFHIVRFGHAHP